MVGKRRDSGGVVPRRALYAGSARDAGGLVARGGGCGRWLLVRAGGVDCRCVGRAAQRVSAG
ncbi:hypothetical protein WK25_11385 [Burkholderia latens]|nr:hypothetical protein WK25_11385 [Burkholderia latens]